MPYKASDDRHPLLKFCKGLNHQPATAPVQLSMSVLTYVRAVKWMTRTR